MPPSPTPLTPETARGNRLLALLPAAELQRLLPSLEFVELPLRTVLYEPDLPITHVYFPLDGVGSLIATLDEGGTVEVGTVGHEGMIGLPVFLGAQTTPLTMIIQIAGSAARMRADALRAEIARGGPFVAVLHRYTQAFFVQLSQSVACNRMHPLQQRCARWLLMTHDRVDGDQFLLTHDFLAQMLGVRRAGVTEAAGELQQAGAIAYERGRIEVLDRARLEGAACECYRIVRAEYDRLLAA